MHDEGTGGNTDGGYGMFPLFPLTNCNFTSCAVGVNVRAALRAAGADGQYIDMSDNSLFDDRPIQLLNRDISPLRSSTTSNWKRRLPEEQA